MEEQYPTINTILNRTSVRSYTEDIVSKEQLELLARAGMAAPSAMNKQPWALIIIDDKSTLDKLGDSLPYAKMTKKASAAIIVCGDLNKAPDGWEKEFWIQDCSAATQNILIAATSMGLGAVWTAAYPATDRVNILKEILEFPDHIIPLNVIPIGHIKHHKEPVDKWNSENIHWQKW